MEELNKIANDKGYEIIPVYNDDDYLTEEFYIREEYTGAYKKHHIFNFENDSNIFDTMLFSYKDTMNFLKYHN